MIPLIFQQLLDPLPLIGPAPATASSLIGPEIRLCNALNGSDRSQVKQQERWYRGRRENRGNNGALRSCLKVK